MNPFTTHTRQQGVTYVEHGFFAMGIAYRLLLSVIAFAVHALMPFISIMPEHDLEATMAYLKERNDWIETAKHSARNNKGSEFVPAEHSKIRI